MENINLKAIDKEYYDKKNGPLLLAHKFIESEGSPADFYGKTKGEVQKRIWEGILLEETNNIWKHIEETEKIDSRTKDPVEFIKNISYLSQKTVKIWNENFQRFRFFENKIYYITLSKANGLDATNVSYEQWSVEGFAKEISHFSYFFEQESSVKKNTNKYLYPLIAIGGWILVGVAIYCITKFFN